MSVVDYKLASKNVRTFTKHLIEMNGGPDVNQGESLDRAIVKCLMMAYFDSVRDEWYDWVKADPKMISASIVARELMKNDNYNVNDDPICGMPGVKPYICKIDDKEAICFDWSMANTVVPLSALYVNKAKEVLDIVDKMNGGGSK